MYHSMDATIGQTTNSLWLYAGTGDYERIGDTTSTNNNMMFGIADPDYPLYRNIATATKAADLSKCKNTTKDASGASCPQLPGDVGWYISLENSQKVTAEPTVSNGLVYFPLFEPSQSANKCSLGLALICAVDDECGTNVSDQLGSLKDQKIDEVIIATSATVEGQTTAYYIQESLNETKVKISKLAQGLPIGGEIENLDDGTLISAFKNRKNF